MSIPSERIVERYWREHGSAFKKPSVFRAFRGREDYFYTMEDDRSIFFFISAKKIKVNVGKKKKDENSSYVTYAVPANKCERVSTPEGEFWSIDPAKNPLPVSCQIHSDNREESMRELAAHFDK